MSALGPSAQRVGRTVARARGYQVTDRLMQFLGHPLDSSQVVTQRSRYRLLDCVWILPPLPVCLRWASPKHNYRNAREVLSTPHREHVSARARGRLRRQ